MLFRSARAGLTGKETVIDAYCGIGTISLSLARHAKKVYGVEIVEAAIADAKKNAALNGLDNLVFEVGAAEEQMATWQEAGIKPDVIMVDPPRKGLAPSLIESAVKMAPQKIVYVSCNPATLQLILLNHHLGNVDSRKGCVIGEIESFLVSTLAIK